MFCSRQVNNWINKLQERALKITNDNQKSDFQDLISKYKEYTIHQRNLQMLVIEIYTIFNNIALPIINSHFLFCENVQNIRNFQILSSSTNKTVRYVLETVSDRSPFYVEIYHKITNLKLLYMPSKQK